MPRKPRIEYAGAVYHVMNRGDRGGKIFKDKLDYDLFVKMSDEVCERTGWKIHAYVLMPNHFHWLLETPGGNLVEGMKWFLSAYSMRFNVRHGQRGHVFQGRYKAVVIDKSSGGHFETASTYIHLNPARANMLPREKPALEAYPWSSYIYYLKPKRKRPKWLRVDRVLGNLALNDDARGRKGYEAYLHDRRADLRKREGKKAFKEEWKALRYGWYVGEVAFGEKLLALVDKAVVDRDRRSYSGGAMQGHDEAAAEKLVKKGLSVAGLSEGDLESTRKGDERKRALAWLVHTRTQASQDWISSRLCMGCSSNISTYIRMVRDAERGSLASLRKALENKILK